MSEVVINGRFRRQRMTGIQRVAHALASRLKTKATLLEPEALDASGPPGYAWEQLSLPLRAGKRLIWGPCNTGPLACSNQILTIHGAAVFDHPEWFSPAFAGLCHKLWPLLARRVRRIVTVSHFSRQRISEVLRIPAAKIDVIWNGVDESFHPASATARARASTAFGLDGRRYFASLSTLEPRKNLQLVLRAWEAASSRLPKDMLLVVIGGRGSRAIFSQCDVDAAAERVVFTGYVEDAVLPGLLSGATAVLYPSIYEGFGLPVLEAMACGVPAVTTRRTSLPEVGGEAALYVEPDDVQGLSDLLIRLATSEDLRGERAALGLERARLFSWADAAEQMDALLARCM